MTSTTSYSSRRAQSQLDWYECESQAPLTSRPSLSSLDKFEEKRKRQHQPSPTPRKWSYVGEENASSASTCPTHCLTLSTTDEYDTDDNCTSHTTAPYNRHSQQTLSTTDEYDTDDKCYSSSTAPFYGRHSQRHQHPQHEGLRVLSPSPVNAAPLLTYHLGTLLKEIKEFPRSPSSVCTTDAIYHSSKPQHEECDDDVSSISPPPFQHYHHYNPFEDQTDDCTNPELTSITPSKKSWRLATPQSLSPLNFPWDAEIQIRLEREEQHRLDHHFKVIEDDVDETDIKPCDNRDLDCLQSLPSSVPLSRKATLQESALHANIAEANAIMMQDDLQWIHPSHLEQRMEDYEVELDSLDSEAREIMLHALTPPQGNKKALDNNFVMKDKELPCGVDCRRGSTCPCQHVPFDCDLSPPSEDDEHDEAEEEHLHDQHRLDTLNQVIQYTEHAIQSSIHMRKIARHAKQQCLKITSRDTFYHLVEEESIASDYNQENERCRHQLKQLKQLKDHMNEHKSRLRDARRRRRERRRKERQGILSRVQISQVLQLTMKIILLLILFCLTVLTCEIVICIAIDKGKSLHTYLLQHSHGSVLSIWDLIALVMMIGVTVMDVAYLSSIAIPKISLSLGFSLNREKEACEHPMIDEVRIVAYA